MYLRVLERYLGQLDILLQKAVQHIEQSDSQEQAILQSRLAEDMFAFHQQVSTCVGFALRAAYPLYDLPIPPLKADTVSFNGLRALVRQGKDFLHALPDEAQGQPMEEDIWSTAGFAERHFSTEEYIHLYALPNFFFHLGIVYALLRQAGVDLSKGDFDGFHVYPPGFRFEQQQASPSQ
ncbi:DUF1993 domain-containing protein [Aliiglaciecola sp. CAU 1673]|uniref:DUF1993 domain-containing protein n=1 Tax=Aliiglaciecola sp. CAU 1673 TaxID=3032595 RepID=UPI0023DB4C4D|nr:DUF1993 domain-containing protein [Aliiglaciecola sp. CAU 1673]MDF2178264.1 DUF1993 domain-containing protein [Aliiglaciecola sp. CAU 1673]